MPFEFIKCNLPDLLIIQPRVFDDDRGFFMETYKRSEFAAHGIGENFVQCNHSKSSRGILRGLHFQKPPKAQGKLVRALRGTIFDVVVDLRRRSATFGKVHAITLSADNKKMLYVPPSFAHGFCVISEDAEIAYMATEEYAPEAESGILWNDPALGIDWPIREPQLSARDHAWPKFTAMEIVFE